VQSFNVTYPTTIVNFQPSIPSGQRGVRFPDHLQPLCLRLGPADQQTHRYRSARTASCPPFASPASGPSGTSACSRSTDADADRLAQHNAPPRRTTTSSSTHAGDTGQRQQRAVLQAGQQLDRLQPGRSDHRNRDLQHPVSIQHNRAFLPSSIPRWPNILPEARSGSAAQGRFEASGRPEGEERAEEPSCVCATRAQKTQRPRRSTTAPAPSTPKH